MPIFKRNKMDEPMHSAADPNNFYTVMIRDRNSENTSDFTVPKRYRDLQFLSAGAQGTVVSATDDITHQRVAIKKMQQPFIMTMSAKRAYREFMLLASIKHPNIIRLHSAYSPQDKEDNFKEVYLVMELMSHNLHEVVSRLKLDHKTLSFFVYQTLCAINHLHKTGIIHRDLKPSNMVVDEKCVLKVLDFGLARKATFDSAVRMSDYVVTRYYRAPEIILGMPYTEKVDIWSVGCIFAEMINHHVLFLGRDKIDQWTKIVSIMGTPGQSFIQRLAPAAANYVNSLPIMHPKRVEEYIPDDNFLSNTENAQAHLTANDARRLLSKMLVIDPDQRYSVNEALNDPYVKLWFRNEEVNLAPPPLQYNQELDFADHGLTEWKSLIFNEVKAFEAKKNPFNCSFEE